MDYLDAIIQLPNTYLAIAFFIIGAVLGSFIATLIIRWPSARSIAFGRSSCDECGQILRIKDLMPLLSYVLMRGKCRYCSLSINPLHWLIELTSATIGFCLFIFLQPAEALGWVLLAWLFMPIFILDYKYLWLPDRLIFIAAIAAPLIAPLVNDIGFVSRIVSAIIGYIFLEGIRISFKKLCNKEVMGRGDPKLLGVLGLYFGWEYLPYIVLIASSTGLIIAATMSIRNGYLNKEQKFPFGAYMVIAAPTAYIAHSLL